MMSATRDWKEPIKFHYGNALADFAHLLPPQEQADIHAREIALCLDKLNSTMREIENAQADLSYYLADIKKMLL